MDNSEREMNDFINVESFSQLPFIRPTPVKEKCIRLFGKDFGSTSATADESKTTTIQEEVKELDNEESSRKFECHYCYRNFPTSQALGGHQNAHKRERQHAKRTQFQSAMAHNSFTDAHMYGIMDYHRLASAPSPPMTYQQHQHNPWSNPSSAYSIATNNNTNKLNGVHSSYSQQPINGSPLGLWRIPAVQNSPTFYRERVINPLLSLATDDLKVQRIGGSSTPQGRFMCEPKASVQDHVSLDLHL